MDFEFATAARIVFGPGRLKEIGAIGAGFGPRALVATPFKPGAGLYTRIGRLLDEHGVEMIPLAVSGEPDVDSIQAGVELARAQRCDWVIGFGGGSAIDTGKAIAALATQSGPLLDFLEVVGAGKALSAAPLPFVAVPTTAGTGAEVTRNAVIGVPERQVKVSLRSPLMLARVALVDPQLTYGAPPEVSAGSGADALTQLIEAFLSNAANPLTDALCREGIARAARALPLVYRDPQHAAAREDMALASLFGGLALANARLGAVHGFAGPVGGLRPAPHGMICARLLPLVFAANLAALRQREANNPVLARFAEVARLLTGDPQAQAQDGLIWLEALIRELHIPGLSRYGVSAADLAGLVQNAQQASSMKGNPIVLSAAELSEILAQAL